MDLQEAKTFVAEFARLNRQARKLLALLETTHDENERKEVYEKFLAINQKLSDYNKRAPLYIGELEEPLNHTITPLQAQRIWDDIRNKIRLAKFNDEGIQPPDIDMKKVFAGKKYMAVHALNDAIQEIICKWSPTL